MSDTTHYCRAYFHQRMDKNLEFSRFFPDLFEQTTCPDTSLLFSAYHFVVGVLNVLPAIGYTTLKKTTQSYDSLCIVNLSQSIAASIREEEPAGWPGFQTLYHDHLCDIWGCLFGIVPLLEIIRSLHLTIIDLCFVRGKDRRVYGPHFLASYCGQQLCI
jgi:hypothetical protein